MKTGKMSFQRLKRLFLKAGIALISMCLLLTSDCSCDDDDLLSAGAIENIMFGKWIIKSAEFDDEVDLDGPGPMLPTTDAKSVLLQIFNFYGGCSSISEIPLEFTRDPASDPDAIASYGNSARSVNAFCPEGYGITTWVFDYVYADYDEGGFSNAWGFYILKDEIDDIGNLFDWNGSMFMRYFDNSENETEFEWYCISESFQSSLEESKPNLEFRLVLERYVEDSE